jgi:Transcriptional regulatory protein, C terminal
MSRDLFTFGRWTLDCGRGALTGPSGEVSLRPKTFDVLRFLVENAGRLVSRDEVLDAVWRNVTVTEESLTHCVSEIRQALADADQRIVKGVALREGPQIVLEPIGGPARMGLQPWAAPHPSPLPVALGFAAGRVDARGWPEGDGERETRASAPRSRANVEQYRFVIEALRRSLGALPLGPAQSDS